MITLRVMGMCNGVKATLDPTKTKTAPLKNKIWKIITNQCKQSEI
jgi:hypothetical protein